MLQKGFNRPVLIRRLLLVFVLLFGGCTSAPREPVSAGWWGEHETVSIVPIAPKDPLYLQVSAGVKRYPDFEVSVGKGFMASVAGNTVGAWAGYAQAVNGAPAGTAAAINPAALAAIILAGPAIEGTTEAIRQGRARNRIEPMRAALDADNPLDGYVEDVRRELSQQAGPTGPAWVVDELNSKRKRARRQEVLDSARSQLVLAIAYVASFTPRFEALELNTVYALFDRSAEDNKPIYTRNVVVQSRLREGLDGQDLRDEVNTMVAYYYSAELEKIEERYGGRQSRKYERAKAIKKARHSRERHRKRWHKVYDNWDLRDVYGERWLEAEGQPMRRELLSLRDEAARLIAADLMGRAEPSSDSKTEPPGYHREMHRLSALDTQSREVYRLVEGPIVSIDRRSRMIPFGDL